MPSFNLPNSRSNMERSTGPELNIRWGSTFSRVTSRRLKNITNQELHGRRESTSSATSLKQNSRLRILEDTSASQPQLVTSQLCQSLPRISPPKSTGGSKELSLMSRTRDSADLAGLSAPLR